MVEYKFPYRWTNTVVRVEHRYNESTGVGGGFFKNGESRPWVAGFRLANICFCRGSREP